MLMDNNTAFKGKGWNVAEKPPKGNIQKWRSGFFASWDTKPSDLPPFVSNFAEKKLTPIFFLEIESLIAKTNFTLGPIEKSIFLVQL